LQRRFPIDDILLHSGVVGDEVTKLSEIAPKFHIFGPPNFGGRPQMSDRMMINLGHRRTCSKV